MCFFVLENLKLPQNPRHPMTTQDTLKSKEFHVQRGTHRIWATFEKKTSMGLVYLPTNQSFISHLGKRKIIFKSDFWWDMLVRRRVNIPKMDGMGFFNQRAVGIFCCIATCWMDVVSFLLGWEFFRILGLVGWEEWGFGVFVLDEVFFVGKWIQSVDFYRFLGRLFWKCQFPLFNSLFFDQGLVFGCWVRKLTVHLTSLAWK